MSDPSLVWLSTRQLAMMPPAGYRASPSGAHLTFHRYGHARWGTYCGVPFARVVAMRRDTAELIADPCQVCWQPGKGR